MIVGRAARRTSVVPADFRGKLPACLRVFVPAKNPEKGRAVNRARAGREWGLLIGPGHRTASGPVMRVAASARRRVPDPQLPVHPAGPTATWQSLEQNDPEMYKLLQADYSLDRQSQELAIQYRQAPKDQREAIKQKLEKPVTEHFEARQQRRLLELKRLEEELKRLRDSIDKRKEAQQPIIDRRVSELLGVQDEPQF